MAVAGDDIIRSVHRRRFSFSCAYLQNLRIVHVLFGEPDFFPGVGLRTDLKAYLCQTVSGYPVGYLRRAAIIAGSLQNRFQYGSRRKLRFCGQLPAASVVQVIAGNRIVLLFCQFLSRSIPDRQLRPVIPFTVQGYVCRGYDNRVGNVLRQRLLCYFKGQAEASRKIVFSSDGNGGSLAFLPAGGLFIVLTAYGIVRSSCQLFSVKIQAYLRSGSRFFVNGGQGVPVRNGDFVFVNAIGFYGKGLFYSSRIAAHSFYPDGSFSGFGIGSVFYGVIRVFPQCRFLSSGGSRYGDRRFYDGSVIFKAFPGPHCNPGAGNGGSGNLKGYGSGSHVGIVAAVQSGQNRFGGSRLFVILISYGIVHALFELLSLIFNGQGRLGGNSFLVGCGRNPGNGQLGHRHAGFGQNGQVHGAFPGVAATLFCLDFYGIYAGKLIGSVCGIRVFEDEIGFVFEFLSVPGYFRDGFLQLAVTDHGQVFRQDIGVLKVLGEDGKDGGNAAGVVAFSFDDDGGGFGLVGGVVWFFVVFVGKCIVFSFRQAHRMVIYHGLWFNGRSGVSFLRQFQHPQPFHGFLPVRVQCHGTVKYIFFRNRLAALGQRIPSHENLIAVSRRLRKLCRAAGHYSGNGFQAPAVLCVKKNGNGFQTVCVYRNVALCRKIFPAGRYHGASRLFRCNRSVFVYVRHIRV